MVPLKTSVAMFLLVAYATATTVAEVKSKDGDVAPLIVEPTKSTNETTTYSPGPYSPTTNSTTAIPSTTTSHGPYPPHINTNTTTTSTTEGPSPPTTTPNTTTTSTTTQPSPTSTTIKPTTISPNTTTSSPVISTTPTPDIPKSRNWDGPSFLSGMVLAFGIVAVGFVGYRFFYLGRGGAYHTL